MQILKSKILLIGDSEKKCNHITEIIKNPWNQVICASNFELAMKESILKSFDLVICFEELSDMNAFQVYSVLNSEILKNQIPFIVILNNYSKNKLLLGTELGIDSFIFPSFDEERILKVINVQLKKNNDRKKIEKLKYDALLNSTPHAVFIAENLKIIEANHNFHKLIKPKKGNKSEYFFRDIFVFNPKNNYELNFFRLVNGLEKNCTFKEVKIVGNKDDFYDVSFFLLNKRGTSYKVIGIIKKKLDKLDIQDLALRSNGNRDNGEKPIDVKLFTNREREILKLSAIGTPVKQIAEHLNISARTVEKHRSNIISKTNTGNIVEAVFLYSKYIINEKADE